MVEGEDNGRGEMSQKKLTKIPLSPRLRERRSEVWGFDIARRFYKGP
jgi:hypothetical protein